MRRLGSEQFIYKMSAENKPVMTIESGETLVIETKDGFGGVIDSDADPFPVIDLERVNQTTGPIYVKGAQPGDALVVDIKKIILPKQGVTTIFPGFGALHDEFNAEWKKVCPIRAGKVIFPKGIKLPVRPVIGTIGVAPAQGAVGNLFPGPHGGNLDVNDVTEGAKILLPVFVPGALFSLGDGKAIMGDGEINGVGIEVAMTVTAKIGLIKGSKIARPRLENARSVMTIASSKTLEQASKTALRDMVDLLVEKTKLSREEAYALLGAVADIKIANVVDPEVTVRVAIPKYVFRQAKKLAK
jgi:amidase